MRFVVRTTLSTEAGNRAIKDPNFLSNLENFIRTNKVEQSYFFEANGERTLVFVLDLPSTDRIPSIAEPLFMMGAKVEFHPVMTFEDLKKGFASMPR
jgi:hypothetical protein